MIKNTRDGELYVLSEAPHKLVNQFDNEDYEAMKKQLLAILDKRPNDCKDHQIQAGMS